MQEKSNRTQNSTSPRRALGYINRFGITLWVYCLFLPLLVFATTSSEDEILGKWYTPKKDAIFDFYRNKETYHARLITLDSLDTRDARNPVDSLKMRKLKGMRIVSNLIYNKEEHRWENGMVYNPRNGKTYSCQCRIMPDQTRMEFRGYIGISALGGTRIFYRVPMPQ